MSENGYGENASAENQELNERISGPCIERYESPLADQIPEWDLVPPDGLIRRRPQRNPMSHDG